MDFYSPASLGFYSSVKIAATLFCHRDLLYLEQKQQHLIGWVRVQESVARQVQCLLLPKTTEESVQELIQPVGDQIRKWLSKRAFVGRCKVDLYDRFSWTSHGTIHYRRTAKNLIESQQLDRSTRFTLACLDAVVEEVSCMARDLPRARGELTCTFSSPLTDWRLENECYLLLKHFEAEHQELEGNFHESATSTLAKGGNTSLTEYFMTKIDPTRKAPFVRILVLQVLRSNNRFLNLDILLILLSHMGAPEIDKLFLENTEIVLLRFLEWPLQRHFTKLANRLWNALSPTTFISILQAIAQHVIQHCSISTNPFGYRDIFRDFWAGSPPDYRRACMNELIAPILASLFPLHGYMIAMLNLFGEESCHEKLETLFFSKADAVLEILSNENKARAFQSIIKGYFLPSDIPRDFDEKYSVFTQKYLESYYGEIDIVDY